MSVVGLSELLREPDAAWQVRHSAAETHLSAFIIVTQQPADPPPHARDTVVPSTYLHAGTLETAGQTGQKEQTEWDANVRK